MFVGGVLAMLGVATIATFALLPGSSVVTNEVATLPQGFSEHATGLALLPGSDTGKGSLAVSWHTNAPANVTLYPAAGCRAASLNCATGGPLATWAASTAGNWSESGALTFPYLLVWTGTGPTNGSLTATATETRSVAAPPPLVLTLLIDGAGAVLAGLGGLAVFLGLFLRGGVYEPRAPLVSHSAEDVAEILDDGSREGPPPGTR